MSAFPIPILEPFDLEAAIAEVLAERMEEMQARCRRERCKAAVRSNFKENMARVAGMLRRGELTVLSVLMFAGVVGVAWIAEQTMRSM